MYHRCGGLLPPNSGMHPTASQRECHRERVCIGVECAAG